MWELRGRPENEGYERKMCAQHEEGGMYTRVSHKGFSSVALSCCTASELEDEGLQCKGEAGRQAGRHQG